MAIDFADFPEYVPNIENYVAPNCMYLNVDDLSPFICSLSLSILMLNIRSCKKNFDNFVANFHHCFQSFSVIIFTETWLTEERDGIYDIPGFYCYNLYRNQYGGGIKIYLKNCIQSKILDSLTVINNVFELLTVELLFCGCKFLLMAVYHPPTSCPSKNLDFVDLFTSYLQNSLQSKLPLIIAGDTNINLLNSGNHFYVDHFINNLLECNMKPLITRPTKINLENPITRFSILDQIWVSDGLTGIQAFIIPINITDHFPVGVSITMAFKRHEPVLVKGENFQQGVKKCSRSYYPTYR